MGTRNLTIVKVNDTYKVAQYGQWDGNPGGVGSDILEFLRSKTNQKKLKQSAALCRFATQEEFEVIKNSSQFSRDVAGQILAMVAGNPNGLILHNSLDFIKDSLFCEWAYVIDFDTNTFEIFKGFNQEQGTPVERFYSAQPDKSGYYPCKFLISWDLTKLPTIRQMVKATNALVKED